MHIFPANKVEVNAAILSLYTDNIQIEKENGLNSYHPVKPVFLMFKNTSEGRWQLAVACFMYNTAFYGELNISNSRYDVYLYQTNAKDLNNAGDKIPTFTLYGIMDICLYATLLLKSISYSKLN